MDTLKRVFLAAWLVVAVSLQSQDIGESHGLQYGVDISAEWGLVYGTDVGAIGGLTVSLPGGGGPASPVTALPTGDGTNTAASAQGGGARYLEVDDAIGAPDDDATYIYVFQSNADATFTFAALDVGSAADYTVKVIFRARETAGNCGHFGQLVIGGVAYTDGATNPTGSYATVEAEWLVNPATGLEWTEGQIEAIQEFGVGTSFGNDAGDGWRCTSAYLEVTY